MLNFKRGTTFDATVVYTPPAGGVPNLIGATITSRLKAANGWFVDLVPTIAPNGLSFSLRSPTGTTNTWHTAIVQWDIKIVIGGVTTFTDTASLNIQDTVTP